MLLFRSVAVLVGCCGVAGSAAAAEECKVSPSIQKLVAASVGEKKSLTFFVEGQRIPVLVTGLGDDCTVQARNREFDRIIIRLDRVSAVAQL